MNKRTKILDTLKQQGYGERNAIIVANELEQLTPKLRSLLDGWLEGKTIDYAALGYSIKQFIEERHMSYPAALLTMDWLIKEPDKAIVSLIRKIR